MRFLFIFLFFAFCFSLGCGGQSHSRQTKRPDKSFVKPFRQIAKKVSPAAVSSKFANRLKKVKKGFSNLLKKSKSKNAAKKPRFAPKPKKLAQKLNSDEYDELQKIIDEQKLMVAKISLVLNNPRNYGPVRRVGFYSTTRGIWTSWLIAEGVVVQIPYLYYNYELLPRPAQDIEAMKMRFIELEIEKRQYQGSYYSY